jgi:nucleoside-diphosphate-sugar epimerase
VTSQAESGFSYLTENMIDFVNGVLAPDMTYGWSKLTGEYLARIAVEKHGLKIGVVRPFSGYGEDQDPTYPVPAIALRVAARQSPVSVWGSGLQGRDFVHIDDCIQGLLLACRKIDGAQAVNLGSGTLTSFLDLARLMVRLESYDAEGVGTDNRPVGVANRVSGSRLATDLLGWERRVSLEEGMLRVLRHAHRRLEAGVRPPL